MGAILDGFFEIFDDDSGISGFVGNSYSAVVLEEIWRRRILCG